MLGYLRVHRRQRFAPTTAGAPMTEAFVHNIERFLAGEGIDLTTFEKGERKDNLMQRSCRSSRRASACCMSAGAGKASIMRTVRLGRKGKANSR